MTVTITKDGVPGLLAGIRTLTQSRVLVGVPDEKADRAGDGEPVTNAGLAYIHDNGAPGANIPARPFMRPGIDNAKDKIVGAMKSGAKNALDGKPDAAETALKKVGLIAQASIRAKITDGPFVPLAPRTIAERKRRGRTGDMKPLIDTGKMRESITYVIRGKS